MAKEVITVPGAPELPFSPTVRAADYIFVFGQVGFQDAEGKELEGIEAQTRQCLGNTKRVLVAANSSLDDVVKVTVFLRSAENFAAMNEIYQGYFHNNQPARSTIITGLALPNMLVEIECIAYSQGP